MTFTPMTSICYVYTALSLLLARLYLNQVYAVPTEGFTTIFSKVPKPSEGGEKQSGSCSFNILSWPTPATDPPAESSNFIFETPQHFSEPQELHPLSVPHHGLLSTEDAYPRAENPLDAGFASLLHGDGNRRAFGDHDDHPLLGENGDLASSSLIHRNDSPLPSMGPQVVQGGQVKSSSQRKRKSRTDIPGNSAQPGMTDDSQLTEVPQDANIHSSSQRKRKFQSKIQQSSAQPRITDQSQLTEVAQHPEGADRAPATPRPPHTTKSKVRSLKRLENARRKHHKTMNEVYEILDFTDRTLNLKKYTTFSRDIMGRISARVHRWLMSVEKSQKLSFKAEGVLTNVENITKISTYLILKDISMLKKDKAEIIPDEKEVENVLLFMDNFWQKIYDDTLEPHRKFTWIPILADRMDPNLFRAISKHRTGAYFWLFTSKEIQDVWRASLWQHPEGAVEARHELHRNKRNSDQERAPAAPGQPRTTKEQLQWEKKSERNKRKHDKTMNEVNEILEFTDRTLELKKYSTFSHEIMGRIEARIDGRLMSGEMGQRPWLTIKSVRQIVENITKISTYFILKDISMLKTDKEEIITDKEEIEEVLLFMDIFWGKLFAGTLKLPGEFTWIPKLAVRMDPNQFGASFQHRSGAYFWLVTSKEIKDLWLDSFGNLSP